MLSIGFSRLAILRRAPLLYMSQSHIVNKKKKKINIFILSQMFLFLNFANKMLVELNNP